MNPEKRAKLEEAGWKIGSAEDFFEDISLMSKVDKICGELGIEITNKQKENSVLAVKLVRACRKFNAYFDEGDGLKIAAMIMAIVDSLE